MAFFYYLTQSVFKVVLQKSTPHKFVDLSCTITNIKNNLTDLCGNRLLQNDVENTLCEIRAHRMNGELLPLRTDGAADFGNGDPSFGSFPIRKPISQNCRNNELMQSKFSFYQPKI